MAILTGFEQSDVSAEYGAPTVKGSELQGS